MSRIVFKLSRSIPPSGLSTHVLSLSKGPKGWLMAATHVTKVVQSIRAQVVRIVRPRVVQYSPAGDTPSYIAGRHSFK